MKKETKAIYYKTLLEGKDCLTKHFFSCTNIASIKTSNFYMGGAIKNYLKACLFQKPYFYHGLNEQTDKYEQLCFKSDTQNKEEHCFEYLDRALSSHCFFGEKHKSCSIKEKAFFVRRFLDYHSQYGHELEEGVSKEIIINEMPIKVKCDFISRRGPVLELINLHQGEPKLSTRARKPENHPSLSLELYLLYLLGKAIDPNAQVVTSLYHLKGRFDKKGEFDPLFEKKPGVNIVSHIFSQEDEKGVSALLNELIEQSNLYARKHVKSVPKNMGFSCRETCSYFSLCSLEKESINKLQLEERVERTEKVASGGSVKLTPKQLEAVLFQEGIARINAGAGAGKTTVVSLRVINLLKQGINPKDILLITFSNKGAQEMREKVAYWAEKFKLTVDISKVNIVTFNSWGARLVEKNYSFLGFSKQPTLAEKVDVFDILIELLDEYEDIPELNYTNPLLSMRAAKGAVVELSNIFSLMKSQLLFDKESLLKAFEVYPSLTKHSKQADVILEMFRAFNAKLIKRNLIQYQDQLNLVLELMEVCPRAIPQYQYIMIDEFQDTNKLQLQLITFLYKSPQFKSLMIVGDDDQSIYGFNFTTPDNIIKFDTLFPNVVDITLADNFRSTPEIISLANTISHININRIDKALNSGLSSKGIVPTYKEFDSSETEVLQIAKSIQEEKIPYEDIAVIARTKDELVEIQAALTQLGVPSIIDVSQVFSKNPAVLLMTQFAMFLKDNALTQGYLCYLMLKDFDQFSSYTMSKIGRLQEEVDLFLKTLEDKNDLEKIDLFFELFTEIAKSDFGLLAFIERLREKDFSSLEKLVDYLTKFMAYNDDTSFEVEGKFKAVNLLTAHSSKGKEYTKVFVSINKFVNTTPSEVEETRRLFFVAITRAKEALTIFANQNKIQSAKEIRDDVDLAIKKGHLSFA